MDDQSLFNWGFWDAYHTDQEPQESMKPAYMAGFKCGVEQRSQSTFNTTAQRHAFEEFESTKEP